jgi:hypothetical protein
MTLGVVFVVKRVIVAMSVVMVGLSNVGTVMALATK